MTAAMRDEFEDCGSAYFKLAPDHEQLWSHVHDASLAVKTSPSESAAVDLQENSSSSLSATTLLVCIFIYFACLLCNESF